LITSTKLGYVLIKQKSFKLEVIHSSREETRPFNVIADDSNGVTCLVLDRQSYREMIADELTRLKREESFKYARKKYVLFFLLNII
jgi:hypothetical protein